MPRGESREGGAGPRAARSLLHPSARPPGGLRRAGWRGREGGEGERGTRMEVSTPHFDRAGGVGAALLLLLLLLGRRRRHSPRRLSLGTRRRAGGAGQEGRRLFLRHLAGDPPPPPRREVGCGATRSRAGGDRLRLGAKRCPR